MRHFCNLKNDQVFAFFNYLQTFGFKNHFFLGLPPPQLSNTLSRSRLLRASIMLDRAMRLMDRLDDPTAPLHPPTEQDSSQQTTQPEDSSDQDRYIVKTKKQKLVDKTLDKRGYKAM